jgi:hypothetical protein
MMLLGRWITRLRSLRLPCGLLTASPPGLMDNPCARQFVCQDGVAAAPLVGQATLGGRYPRTDCRTPADTPFAQDQPLKGEIMVTNPEMWGRDIEACRQLRSSMLTLRIRHADELSRFPRSNLLLNMLDRVLDAAQVTIDDAEERLLEKLQVNGHIRESPPCSDRTLDTSHFGKPQGVAG